MQTWSSFKAISKLSQTASCNFDYHKTEKNFNIFSGTKKYYRRKDFHVADEVKDIEEKTDDVSDGWNDDDDDWWFESTLLCHKDLDLVQSFYILYFFFNKLSIED